MTSGSGRSRPPLIGVSWIKADQAAADHLIQAVRAAGGEPVPLTAEAPSWTAEIKTLDGLVLSGGNAVDPRRYGQVNEGLCRTVIPHRDELEFEAFQHCQEHSLPILGVCRGIQFVNVACGGSMLQDLPITTVEHEAVGDVSRFHPIQVLPGTRLAEMAGPQEHLRVNSRHHQGMRVEHLAPGLRVSALAPDGVVEGLEGAGEAFLVGIQFHPERPGEVPEMVGIFDALVARAR
ncbi:MAG TPA: type 1 glutamine amidotransferase, partial [Candidatus Methylomirabilis sp.]|nr:type 1 glutamine amidotransferase [Candidatus Methylomirabilis sp.]